MKESGQRLWLKWGGGHEDEVLGSSGGVPQVHEQTMCKPCANHVHYQTMYYQPTITIIKENNHTLHI